MSGTRKMLKQKPTERSSSPKMHHFWELESQKFGSAFLTLFLIEIQPCWDPFGPSREWLWVSREIFLTLRAANSKRRGFDKGGFAEAGLELHG